MGSGIQVVTGAFLGTGSALSIEKVGFLPRIVRLSNYTDPGTLTWVEGMPDAGGVKHVDGTTAILTTTGITPTRDGFDLGTDTDINVDGEQVFYECYR